MKSDAVELLLEVGCEEIPAGLLAGAATELQVTLQKYLSAENLLIDGASVETFAAPRRLVATCSKLRPRQEDVSREVTGPPKAIAFDAEGRPTRAAESFAGKQGVPLDKLYLVNTPRGEYLAAAQVTKGRSASERLTEILPRAVGEISWPRTMYWTGMSGARFIRPIRWVVALLGGQIVHFQIGDVASGNITAGHRFLGKARIPVTGFADYVSKLKKNYVMVRPAERSQKSNVSLRIWSPPKACALIRMTS